jgi:hypothetical protein
MRPAFDFIQMHNLEAIACTRVIALSLGRAHGCAKCKAPDASKAVNAYFHVAFSY